MNTISFPAAVPADPRNRSVPAGREPHAPALQVPEADRGAHFEEARPDIGQFTEDGLMLLLSVIGFVSVGWSLFATW